MTQDTPRIDTLASLSGKAPWRLGLQHFRDDHLLIWITRGQGRAIVAGQRKGMGINNMLFIPAGTLFSVDPGPQGFGLAMVVPPDSGVPLPERNHHLRLRDVHAQQELTALVEAMQREQSGGGDLHAAALRAHATLITIWLKRALVDAPESAAASAEARIAAAFTDLVVRDFRSGKPMAAYAEKLDITPTHLTRCLNTTAGMSAAAILTECSLHAARSLLCDTDHPVGRISEHLGFGSPAYFTRFVQQHTGKTPSGLRDAGSSVARKVSQP
ncbi:helix-turn-helix transcriptional regulator [Aquicoccus sp.]|uniref:helix-turn-helix transcriptional regulator n=1 Tax=Aquicoccus sp. TaxID=2055851 RepID=UPI00356964F1